MRTSNQFCMKIARSGLGIAGGMLLLAAIGGTAMAQTTAPVPEIDPTSIASAVTLFMGSVMLLTARRKLK